MHWRYSSHELTIEIIINSCWNITIDFVFQIWIPYLQGRREDIFKTNPRYKKFWNLTKKNDNKTDEETKKKLEFERTFLAKHIKKFYKILDSAEGGGMRMDIFFILSKESPYHIIKLDNVMLCKDSWNHPFSISY